MSKNKSVEIEPKKIYFTDIPVSKGIFKEVLL